MLFEALDTCLECVNNDRVDQIKFCSSHLLISLEDSNNRRGAFPYASPYKIGSQYNVGDLNESLETIVVENRSGARFSRVQRRNSLQPQFDPHRPRKKAVKTWRARLKPHKRLNQLYIRYIRVVGY